jgi:hypothetical protein
VVAQVDLHQMGRLGEVLAVGDGEVEGQEGEEEVPPSQIRQIWSRRGAIGYARW